jgi:hypothetical protein
MNCQDCECAKLLKGILERHDCERCWQILEIDESRHKTRWVCWVCGRVEEREMRF